MLALRPALEDKIRIHAPKPLQKLKRAIENVPDNFFFH